MYKSTGNTHIIGRVQTVHDHAHRNAAISVFSFSAFRKAKVGLLLVMTIFATTSVLAQSKNLGAAITIVDQTTPFEWSPKPPKNPSFTYYFKRFMRKHGLIPKANYKLEKAPPSLWLHDDIMGRVRDRPARPRTGPEMGTYYDASGHLRVLVPDKSSAGKYRVLGSPPAELLRKYKKQFAALGNQAIGWDKQQKKVATALAPDDRGKLDKMIALSQKEKKDSVALNKTSLRKQATTPTKTKKPKPAQPLGLWGSYNGSLTGTMTMTNGKYMGRVSRGTLNFSIEETKLTGKVSAALVYSDRINHISGKVTGRFDPKTGNVTGRLSGRWTGSGGSGNLTGKFHGHRTNGGFKGTWKAGQVDNGRWSAVQQGSIKETSENNEEETDGPSNWDAYMCKTYPDDWDQMGRLGVVCK